MAKRSTRPLSGPSLYRVAGRANVSPATVTRCLDGLAMVENNRRAIVEALRAEGLAHLIPAEPATAA